jgi:hypothetical protein
MNFAQMLSDTVSHAEDKDELMASPIPEISSDIQSVKKITSVLNKIKARLFSNQAEYDLTFQPIRVVIGQPGSIRTGGVPQVRMCCPE